MVEIYNILENWKISSQNPNFTLIRDRELM